MSNQNCQWIAPHRSIAYTWRPVSAPQFDIMRILSDWNEWEMSIMARMRRVFPSSAFKTCLLIFEYWGNICLSRQRSSVWGGKIGTWENLVTKWEDGTLGWSLDRGTHTSVFAFKANGALQWLISLTLRIFRWSRFEEKRRGRRWPAIRLSTFHLWNSSLKQAVIEANHKFWKRMRWRRANNRTFPFFGTFVSCSDDEQLMNLSGRAGGFSSSADSIVFQDDHFDDWNHVDRRLTRPSRCCRMNISVTFRINVIASIRAVCFCGRSTFLRLFVSLFLGHLIRALR